MFSGSDETLEINCKCRACSHQAKMNLSDRQMKKIFNLVRPTGVHETMVDKADENKSLVKKEKEKVIAKISDQNYLIGSDELNSIVNQVRNKYLE